MAHQRPTTTHPTRDGLAYTLLTSILLVLALSFIEQALRPVTGFDERMYNCSRVLYWHQHQHIWPWLTHNEAQVDFPIGSEVFFSWPLLYTKLEWVARLVYWMGFPALVAGVYTLGRALGSSVRLALLAALIVAATPTILTSAGMNQKQDIWAAVFLVGVGFWAVHCRKTGGVAACLWSGLFLALAVNVKVTNAIVTPVLAAAALMAEPLRSTTKRWTLQAIGGVSGILLSGLAITFGHNILQYGNPISSPGSRQTIQPDFSLKQMYTHAVRVPAFLIELPVQPIEPFRAAFETAGNRLIDRLGAGDPLPLETNPIWPGSFKFTASPAATRFSLGGVLWLIMLCAGAAAGARQLIARPPLLPPGLLVLAMSGVLLAGLAFLVRWMGGADRYWIAPYALGIPGSIWLLSTCTRCRPFLAAAACTLVPLAVLPAARTVLTRIDHARLSPPTTEERDEPFAEILSHTPRGSRIMLFGNRNVRDYPLFLPRDSYPNQVYPYGKPLEFDAARVAAMIQAHNLTHIVFEDDRALGFHWDGGRRMDEATEWFDRSLDFEPVPLEAANQRLYQRIDPAASHPIQGFGGWNYSRNLEPAESLAGPSGPALVRWGTGNGTTFRFTNRGEPMVLIVEARRGEDPGQSITNQSITIKLNGEVIHAYEFPADQDWHTLTVPLTPQAGFNMVTLKYGSQQGDRRLAVLYRALRIRNALP